MSCPTHKVCYDTRELAEEALLQNHARFYHTGTGPVNVYACDYCGSYHFTSKGEVHELLRDDKNKKRIELGREANYWEEKYRRK